MKSNKGIKLNKDELTKALGQVIILIFASAFFGYCGYVYCLDNNYNILRGIVFGALLPAIMYVINDKFGLEFIKMIILILVWIAISEYMPLAVGIIALTLVAVYSIAKIIIVYRDIRKEKINKNNEIINYNKNYHPQQYFDKEKDDTDTEFLKDEYFCERCEEPISEEEYMDYGGLCEDCYTEVYFGERYDGDDHDLYK